MFDYDNFQPNAFWYKQYFIADNQEIFDDIGFRTDHYKLSKKIISWEEVAWSLRSFLHIFLDLDYFRALSFLLVYDTVLTVQPDWKTDAKMLSELCTGQAKDPERRLFYIMLAFFQAFFKVRQKHWALFEHLSDIFMGNNFISGQRK